MKAGSKESPELRKRINRIASEHSKAAYQSRRDELLREVTRLQNSGEDVEALLSAAERQAMRTAMFPYGTTREERTVA